MAETVIPAEAIRAAAEAIDERYPDVSMRLVDGAVQLLAVEAAAPHIARAARIDELRKLLELKDTAIEWGVLDWYVRVDDIEARIAELEAQNA